MAFFFDTYALLEATRGNHAYDKFIGSSITTTRFNLMEMYYSLLRLTRDDAAEEYYNRCLELCASIRDEDIKTAMRFKLEMRRKGVLLSYVDAIGYVFARKKGHTFVTGDPHFRHLPHVEFVP